MPTSPSRWFPIFFVLLSSILVTAAEVFMKLGASDSMAGGVTWGPAMILNLWVIFGIIAYIAGLAVWLIALPRMALHLAYGLSAVVHLLVPLASWLFLMEHIPLGRIVGMTLVLIGSIVLAFVHKRKQSS